MENPSLAKQIQHNLENSPQSTGWWNVPELKAAARTSLPDLVCPSDSSSDLGKGAAAVVHTYLLGSVPMLQCGAISPANGAAEMSRTNYLGVSGAMGHVGDSIWDRWRGLFSNRSDYSIKHVVDGTSHTLMFGETRGYENNERKYVFSWLCGAMPTGYGLDGSTWSQFSSAHKGVTQFGFIDGSVHAISTDVSPDTYRAMSGIADRESYPDPW
jgi:hypothetical protein